MLLELLLRMVSLLLLQKTLQAFSASMEADGRGSLTQIVFARIQEKE